MSLRRPRSAMALILAMIALGPSATGAQTATDSAAPAQASEVRLPAPPQRGEDEDFVRSPNDAPLPPLPPPQQGLLETSIPSLREGLSRLPPFLRDMDVNARLRSFYFNRQNDNGTASEAWTLGGWVDVASGWLLDTFAIGATYYASLPAYAPEDRPGSLLLTPGQETIGVFGQAWGALRYKDYALLKGYRQWIDDGYVNPQDNRMIPNTFEGVTLSGKLDAVRYDLGYVAAIKSRDSNDFIAMSSQAGAPGDGQGLILSTLAFTPSKQLLIYTGNFYALDVFKHGLRQGRVHPTGQPGGHAAVRSPVHGPAQPRGSPGGGLRHLERRSGHAGRVAGPLSGGGGALHGRRRLDFVPPGAPGRAICPWPSRTSTGPTRKRSGWAPGTTSTARSCRSAFPA